MAGGYEPLRWNECSAALEISFLVQSRLPRPSSGCRIGTAHNPSFQYTNRNWSNWWPSAKRKKHLPRSGGHQLGADTAFEIAALDVNDLSFGTFAGGVIEHGGSRTFHQHVVVQMFERQWLFDVLVLVYIASRFHQLVVNRRILIGPRCVHFPLGSLQPTAHFTRTTFDSWEWIWRCGHFGRYYDLRKCQFPTNGLSEVVHLERLTKSFNGRLEILHAKFTPAAFPADHQVTCHFHQQRIRVIATQRQFQTRYIPEFE